MDPFVTIKVGNTLGECVLWNGETQSLWWTDIQERRLYSLDWQARTIRNVPTPERLCSFGFVAGGSRLIAAFERGFALFDPDTGATEWLRRVAPGRQRLNDGRVDSQGRFWAGTMAEHPHEACKAELFSIGPDGRVECHERGITISNGICWSPDGTSFYFADSGVRTIWQYAFSFSDGKISDKRVFAQTPEGTCPDGAAVDAEGFVWSAQWGGGRIVRYSPDGAVDRILEVPASRPTCVAFGGPKLDLMFVTSAREGLDGAALAREPSAGDVFVYNVGVSGLPENRFRFEGLPTGGC